jgi:predicted MFS family arabinose efflux permease
LAVRRLSFEKSSDREFVRLAVFATAILLVSTGIRNTTGLFVNPIVKNTVMSLTDVSMAMAIGQFAFGLFQPLGGMLTAKYGTFRVLLSGALCLIAGLTGVRFAATTLPLVLCLGLLAPAGAAAGSFPILMGHISGYIPEGKRPLVSGLVSAGGSAGQFILAPLIQIFINQYGYYGACIFLAIVVALSVAPSWYLCRGATVPGLAEEVAGDEKGNLKEEIKAVFRKPTYLILHTGFFACGFHVAFIATHLPGEIEFYKFDGSFTALCFSVLGIFNIVGCVLGGMLGRHFALKNILGALYASRAVVTALYLASPKTAPVFVIFSAIVGLSFGSTVPPTGDITSVLVRPKYYSAGFGLIFATHQIGSFFGAWAGGYVMDMTGGFFPVWVGDIILSAFAALISFRIREQKVILDRG